ncbi:Scr1 family TA system antitoxin-like transcriptional regulator [Streptomyces sp. NPDC021218]|uniref:Scr1 family TA system antitoxin-like transcriptional regulator n=1 Tax=Streptomyces sp. NPDC021218 TaxID=3365119 RepID=UPI0037BDE225
MRTPSHYKIRPPHEGEAPAAAALVVGAYLRAVRHARRLTGSDAAWAIRCSAAKVSRLETGSLHRMADATGLLDLYGIDDLPSLTAVEHLLREPRRHSLFDPAPGWLDRLHACQQQADTMVIYSAFAVPDIARISTYPAEAQTQWPRDDTPIRVRPRASLTAENGGGVTLLLDQMVLERPPSRPSVAPAQYSHLRQLASSARGPQILVVPLEAQVIPRASHMYGMTLHGHDLVVEQHHGYLHYYTGEEAAQRRHFLQAAQAAGVHFP